MKREGYLRKILRLYRLLPDTPNRCHSGDRAIVIKLFEDQVSVERVEVALLLGAARRVCRDPGLPALDPIRSIAYFLPVLEQLPETPPPDGYVQYLRLKLQINTTEQNAPAQPTKCALS